MGYTDKYNTIGEKIIIGRVGAKCGNVHYINSPKWISDNALIFTLNNKKNYKYFSLLISLADLNKLNTSSAQPLITGTKVIDIHLPLAPDSEQIQIVSYHEGISSSIDLAINKIKKEIELIKEYRQTLISKVVTGQIDVREEA
ncbi:MAG: hypothetical protein A2Y40_01530 [Candidatus Margulisbacteria bacterium GWF2_35_9]|nr:MAG: hypothetical protein A2Y40_01530 [Candidatus Margulisbacteria bacterium GWF2_35_9]